MIFLDDDNVVFLVDFDDFSKLYLGDLVDEDNVVGMGLWGKLIIDFVSNLKFNVIMIVGGLFKMIVKNEWVMI